MLYWISGKTNLNRCEANWNVANKTCESSSFIGERVKLYPIVIWTGFAGGLRSAYGIVHFIFHSFHLFGCYNACDVRWWMTLTKYNVIEFCNHRCGTHVEDNVASTTWTTSTRWQRRIVHWVLSGESFRAFTLLRRRSNVILHMSTECGDFGRDLRLTEGIMKTQHILVSVDWISERCCMEYSVHSMAAMWHDTTHK